MSLCECGCGQDAGVYKSSFLTAGIVQGTPKTYIKGHHRRGIRSAMCKNGHVRPVGSVGKCEQCKRAAVNRNYAKHRDKKLEKQRTRQRQIRLEVLAHYGGKCACCGISEFEFLAIDHINGGGNIHRKEIKDTLTMWLYRNDYPKGFRVLCHNCNFSLGAYGYCPHSKEAQWNQSFTALPLASGTECVVARMKPVEQSSENALIATA